MQAVVGVVDRACDFTHPDLRDAIDGGRLLALWDQRSDVVHWTRDLARALEARDPFRALGYEPFDEDRDSAIEIVARTAPNAMLAFVHVAAPRATCVRDAIEL